MTWAQAGAAWHASDGGRLGCWQTLETRGVQPHRAVGESVGELGPCGVQTLLWGMLRGPLLREMGACCWGFREDAGWKGFR